MAFLAANKFGKFWISTGSQGQPICRGTYKKTEAYRFSTASEAQEWVDSVFRKGQVQSEPSEELTETEGTRLIRASRKVSRREVDRVWNTGCQNQDEEDSDWFANHQL